MSSSEDRIYRLAKAEERRGSVTFSEALGRVMQTDEGKRLYGRSLTEPRPRVDPSDLDEDPDPLHRSFVDEDAGRELMNLEEVLDSACRKRCRERGWLADQVGIARALVEVLAESPELYQQFTAAHIAASE